VANGEEAGVEGGVGGVGVGGGRYAGGSSLRSRSSRLLPPPRALNMKINKRTTTITATTAIMPITRGEKNPLSEFAATVERRVECGVAVESESVGATV